MRAVLDTNVFISGILWKGTPHKIIELAEKQKIEIAISLEILEELAGVIKRPKFKPYLNQAESTPQQIVERVVSLTQVFLSTKRVTIIKIDPTDNMFLSCALASGASFIISGDKHLLNLKQYQGIKVISPAQFFKLVSRL